MSYRSIVAITERINDIFSEPFSPEEAFNEAYGDLQELVSQTRNTSFHRSNNGAVQSLFARLHGQLSAIADNLYEASYHEQIWLTLQEALSVSERIAAIRPLSNSTIETGSLLDPTEAVVLLRDDPDELFRQADAELRADPGSIVGAYLTAASQLCLGRFSDAIATADALALLYPARHVVTITTLATMLQGRQEEALIRAQDGLYCRLEARRPEPWFRISGLCTLTREEAEAIRQTNVTMVQMALEWLADVGLDDGQRMIFIGLLAPSLSQARLLLEEHQEQANSPIWADAVRLGLARCARWRCDFMEASRILEGMTGYRARHERTLLSRDRRLLEAGEIELAGFGVTLSIYRTTTCTGFSWAAEAAQLTNHDDRSAEQIADLLKDLTSSWISTGFSYRIIQEGPLPGDNEAEAEDSKKPTVESLVDIDRFFSLYDAERLDDVLVFTEEVLAEKPHAVTAWGMRILIHLIRGQWAEAALESEQAVALSGCRALGAAQVLRPASEGALGTALIIGMENLALRLRSATPEMPLELPGFPTIQEQEGDLLDQIELNTWRILDGMLSTGEETPEQIALEGELLSALMAPNPANTIQLLEAMMPRLETHLALKAAAATALCRWRRYEGDFDEAEKRLAEARAALPGMSFVQAEHRRMLRDRRLCASTELTLRGFGVTLNISRTDRLLERSFTPDNGSMHQTLTSWVEDPRPQAPALTMRDVVVSWLESGFSLLEDGPGD